MLKFLKVTVLILIVGGLGFQWFHARWSTSKELYTSPETMKFLNIVPEEVYQIAPPDESNIRSLSMGFASLRLPQDDTAFLTVKELDDYYSVYLLDQNVRVHFAWPVPVKDTFESYEMEKTDRITKTQWRESRLLKATDTFDHTLLALPDLELYIANLKPKPFWQLLLMSNWNAGFHIGRLKAKRDILPWTLKRIVPFESQDVVGVVYLCSRPDESEVVGFTYLSSVDRQILQALIFCDLPESSSDTLDPVWQVLAGYRFHFDSCPDESEIRRLIVESGMAVSRKVLKDILGFTDTVDHEEFTDILLSDDVFGATLFWRNAVKNCRAVEFKQGDEVYVLEQRDRSVKFRNHQDTTTYWTLCGFLDNGCDQECMDDDETGLSSKPQKEDTTLD